MGLMDVLIDPIGAVEQHGNAKDRQEKQWQTANHALETAVELLGRGGSTPEDYTAALATAVTGLLALHLSRT